jgi:hypothetical protein
MLELIDLHPGDAGRTALAVLLDWWLFDPEPGYEEYLDSNNQPVNLVLTIQATVRAASPMLERVTSDMHDPRSARPAADLLLCARDGWGSYIQDGTLHHRSND